jgi:hypothetical protein
MRERTRADFAEAVEFGYIFNSNDYFTLTHKSQITILQNNPLLVYSKIFENDRMSAIFH